MRINRTPPVYFSTLQDAYNNANSGEVIQSIGIEFAGNLINADLSNTLKITNNINITLAGGYDCGYTTNSGNVTSLDGMIQTFPSAGSVTISNFILTAVPPSGAPSSLIATPISDTQIGLSWTDNSNNERGFKVERKTGVNGTYSQVTTVGANVTTYTDAGLTYNTTYYYRVKAYNAGGDSGYSNEAGATTLIPPPPSAPTNLTATAVSSIQINLSWVDNANNETGFKIERKTGTGGTYAQIATVGANVTTYSDTGLTANTTYYFRVRAYNENGDSAYSNETNVMTLGYPTYLTASATSDTQISLSWTDNSTNETGFKIERKTGATGTYSQIATVGANVTTYSNTGLTANTTYYYRVRAYNAGGNSSLSNEAYAKTWLYGSSTKTRPLSVTQDSTAAQDWSNLSNVATSDNLYAVNLGDYYSGHETMYCTNYGFNIPLDAAITGIQVIVEGYYAYPVGNQVGGVSITYGDYYPSPKTFIWQSTDSNYILGGTNDTWGWDGTLGWDRLTPYIINYPSFGVVLFPVWQGNTETDIYVDNIRITVYYVIK